jgi:molybdenum cofactor synthesis domain-containing protein
MQWDSIAIAVIGDEILNGGTRDGNSYWLVQRLVELGAEVGIIVVLPDKMDVIVPKLRELMQEYHAVITTGGIGPTHDDMTREAVAEACGRKLVLNQGASDMIGAAHKGELTEVRLRMAMLPEGCSLIGNVHTGAPGFNVDNVYVFPGIPSLLYAMFEEVAEDFRGGQFYKKSIRVDAGESKFANTLSEAQEKYPEVAIGSYPKYEEKAWVEVRLRSRDEEKLQQCCDWLQPRLGEIEQHCRIAEAKKED